MDILIDDKMQANYLMALAEDTPAAVTENMAGIVQI